MRTSAEGRKRLGQREGQRLTAYRDSVGVLTIGRGHTSAAGPPEVTPGLTITQAECDEIFARDLVKYENAVNAAVKVSLDDHEFDALVSFCYNIGPAGFRSSHTVSLLNQGFRNEAADAMLGWSRPPEIMGRRRSEVAQFKTPYASQPAPTRTPPPPDIPKPVPKPAPQPSALAAIVNAVLSIFTNFTRKP